MNRGTITCTIRAQVAAINAEEAAVCRRRLPPLDTLPLYNS
ncbi:hypothetical protein CLOSYM_03951 [[Clostridium] symbiosum ATCC 14940]|uniref:Uncharacterized protein n=1 Tax=[Clostridium] symbiosum ATCC 14940 TaxID=411472 RepID=A0ABC9TTJ3_CLOSY|nr:hypothetical protein CLOSYM_03951 [[Clostridium] symbiosum ATCC 14940]